jgi:rare lipoprotein A (peptidoglycan hydrolase)
MKYLLSFAFVLSVFAVGNAQTFEWNTKSAEAHPKEVNPNDPARIAYEKAFNERQIGMAGVYNPNAQGNRTAYNETYVNKQLTASHALLPLGTLVRVQNLDNNRFVSVRINDKGQECSDCLLMLSQGAAEQLGINYRGRVSVERTGFSNWNPAPPPAAPVAYRTQEPVTRPVQINNNQWQARSGNAQSPATYGSQAQSPAAYGSRAPGQQASTYNQPAAYGTPNYQTTGNYAVLSAPNTPSVVSREVQPATVSRQPATYSRYPAASTPMATNNQPRVYQPAPSSYNTPTPVYQQPAPVQQQPAPVTRQATPPPSTVKRYQESRVVPAPATYQTPSTYNAPQAYSPAPQMQARGVATPTAAAPATTARQYGVQLGAYSNEIYAKARVEQLQKMGMSNIFYRSIQKPDGQMINRVYAGTFASMAEAQQAGKLIRGNFQIAGIASAL